MREKLISLIMNCTDEDIIIINSILIDMANDGYSGQSIEFRLSSLIDKKLK